MKKEEVIPFDLKRMFLGQAPPEFMVEVLIRTLIVYLIAIVIVRLLGKRMNGQLSILEMSVMVLMGAILSLPMQSADRGILQGVVALLTVLFLLRGVNWLTFRRAKLEQLVHGKTALLVKDGVLQIQQLASAHISKQQLFGVLRSNKITNLGQIKRVYLEPYGDFSVYPAPEVRPGLSLLPPTDKDLTETLQGTGEKVCTNCGQVLPAPEAKQCPNCTKNSWTEAVTISEKL